MQEGTWASRMVSRPSFSPIRTKKIREATAVTISGAISGRLMSPKAVAWRGIGRSRGVGPGAGGGAGRRGGGGGARRGGGRPGWGQERVQRRPLDRRVAQHLRVPGEG